MDAHWLEQLREAIPELVRRHPEIAAEIQLRLRDAFASKDDIRLLIETMDRRFEALQTEMNRRFEALQTEMNRRFEALRTEMDRRFEVLQTEMDRRFEALDRRFEALDRRFEAMDRRMADLQSWVQMNVGGLQRRAGRKLEDTIAGTLRFALGVGDIRPEHLQLRRKMRDADGLIGPKGRDYEYDILATNGETFVFEIKSVAEVEDIERFADKAELLERILGRPLAGRILVTLDRPRDVAAAARRRGITLV
jgi:hypothetical protein